MTINTLIDDRLALLSSLRFTVPKREKLTMKALNEKVAEAKRLLEEREQVIYKGIMRIADGMVDTDYGFIDASLGVEVQAYVDRSQALGDRIKELIEEIDQELQEIEP